MNIFVAQLQFEHCVDIRDYIVFKALSLCLKDTIYSIVIKIWTELLNGANAKQSDIILR